MPRRAVSLRLLFASAAIFVSSNALVLAQAPLFQAVGVPLSASGFGKEVRRSRAVTVDFSQLTKAEAERINWRFQGGKWKPIVLLVRQHSHQEIEPYYRAADLCLVTSLHDGMNLVAKEFLAARHDERGVLILSQFTGAARELRDALLVNPYDIDQTAEAIRAALEMEPEDKALRVQRMRKVIKEHNIYRWAGNLITELCEVRLDQPEDVQEKLRASMSVA